MSDDVVSTLFRAVSDRRRAGDWPEALGLLRDAIRRSLLAPGDLERAGRILLQAPLGPTTSVRVLGQVTTTWIPPVLTALAWGDGIALAVTTGGFDTVLQDVEQISVDGAPDVLVLIPSPDRLLAGDDDAVSIAGELAWWEAVWARRSGARLVQLGYDVQEVGPRGVGLSTASGGALRRTRDMNMTLRDRLPAGGAWVDVDRIAGDVGRRAFYDPRGLRWSGQPWSEAGLVALCHHARAAIRAITTGPRKVLVLDLDDTLWGGVVGEVGAQGVAVRDTPEGEGYRAFQQHCLGLARRGVLLAVASKNNPDDAREPFFSNASMTLKLTDFAAFEASWSAKSESLVRIATQLRLGLDSLVFFDDNPAERDHVRQMLPDVCVVDVPDDPTGYVRALEAGLWFEAVALTAEDEARSAHYQAEQARVSAAAAHDGVEGWLRSLDMQAHVAPFTEPTLERVVQLFGKTNQFNLTTRRHTVDQVRAFATDPDTIALAGSVRDRFGDHGLVTVIVGVPGTEGTIRVDSWLMSCRVIGRTVEHHVWAAFLSEARARGYTRVEAEFIPTGKNAQVGTMYASLGLSRVEDREGHWFAAAIDDIPTPVTFVGVSPGSPTR